MKHFFDRHFYKIENIVNLNNYKWSSIFINLFFSFILTILFVSLPFTENDSLANFGDNFYQKLATGALLSSIVSMTGTYIITLWTKIKIKYNIQNSSADTSIELKSIIVLEQITYTIVPIICCIIASGLLFISQNNKLHSLMICIQIIIYVVSLLFFGYTEKFFTPEDFNSEQKSYTENQGKKAEKIVRSISNSANAKMIEKARKNKLKE